MEYDLIDKEIDKARALSAEIFYEWNNKRLAELNSQGLGLTGPESQFNREFSLDQIFDGLQEGFEPHYLGDNIKKLGEKGAKDGLLNMYDSFNYGMNNPDDPYVVGMDQQLALFLAYCKRISDRKAYMASSNSK